MSKFRVLLIVAQKGNAVIFHNGEKLLLIVQWFWERSMTCNFHLKGLNWRIVSSLVFTIVFDSFWKTVEFISFCLSGFLERPERRPVAGAVWPGPAEGPLVLPGATQLGAQLVHLRRLSGLGPPALLLAEDALLLLHLLQAPHTLHVFLLATTRCSMCHVAWFPSYKFIQLTSPLGSRTFTFISWFLQSL